MLVLFLLLVPLAAAQATGSSLISAPIAAGGNGTIIRITNDLGPTAVFVQFGATSVIFDITYYAADSAALASLTALQPTSATIEQDEITLTLVGGTSIPADDLGGSCKLVTFTASSPRPPCQPFTYTPSPSAPSTRSSTDAAYVQVSVPEETTICVNGWCSNPLYYALPAISPQTFSDLGNGVIYDATQGLMWQQSLLPGSYPYDSENGNNFPTINNAAQACYALQLGGFEDWRLPTRSELHRWADHSVSPAQNSSFFPVSTDTEDEAYWTVIRTKVNDYLGALLCLAKTISWLIVTNNRNLFHAIWRRWRHHLQRRRLLFVVPASTLCADRDQQVTTTRSLCSAGLWRGGARSLHGSRVAG